MTTGNCDCSDAIYKWERPFYGFSHCDPSLNQVKRTGRSWRRQSEALRDERVEKKSSKRADHSPKLVIEHSSRNCGQRDGKWERFSSSDQKEDCPSVLMRRMGFENPTWILLCSGKRLKPHLSVPGTIWWDWSHTSLSREPSVKVVIWPWAFVFHVTVVMRAVLSVHSGSRPRGRQGAIAIIKTETRKKFCRKLWPIDREGIRIRPQLFPFEEAGLHVPTRTRILAIVRPYQLWIRRSRLSGCSEHQLHRSLPPLLQVQMIQSDQDRRFTYCWMPSRLSHPAFETGLTGMKWDWFKRFLIECTTADETSWIRTFKFPEKYIDKDGFFNPREL
jgi:hypothetical protein